MQTDTSLACFDKETNFSIWVDSSWGKKMIVMENNIQEFVCCHYTEPKIKYSMSNHALSSNCSSPLKLILYHFDCKGYLHSRETDEAEADRFTSVCNLSILRCVYYNKSVNLVIERKKIFMLF